MKKIFRTRDSNIYLKDILQSIRKIEKYTKGLTLAKYKKDSLIKDAVLRNLGVIREAARHILPSVKKDIHDIDWQKIIGLRNILIHEYFGVDEEIIWDIAVKQASTVKQALTSHLK